MQNFRISPKLTDMITYLEKKLKKKIFPKKIKDSDVLKAVQNKHGKQKNNKF